MKTLPSDVVLSFYEDERWILRASGDESGSHASIYVEHHCARCIGQSDEKKQMCWCEGTGWSHCPSSGVTFPTQKAEEVAVAVFGLSPATPADLVAEEGNRALDAMEAGDIHYYDGDGIHVDAERARQSIRTLRVAAKSAMSLLTEAVDVAKKHYGNFEEAQKQIRDLRLLNEQLLELMRSRSAAN